MVKEQEKALLYELFSSWFEATSFPGSLAYPGQLRSFGKKRNVNWFAWLRGFQCTGMLYGREAEQVMAALTQREQSILQQAGNLLLRSRPSAAEGTTHSGKDMTDWWTWDQNGVFVKFWMRHWLFKSKTSTYSFPGTKRLCPCAWNMLWFKFLQSH